jgi:hypothetical protein
MTNHNPSLHTPDALDQLVDELLGCGAVLSQMIGHMVEFESSGRTAPDAAPIPEVAHELIRGVSKHVAHRYSRRDIKTAAKIVKDVTDAICSEVIYVPPEEVDRLLEEGPDDASRD